MAATEKPKGAASGDAPKTKTKAQAEFERYKARVGAPPAAMAAMTGPSGTGFPQPAAFPQAGVVPAWAFPPSIAALPQAPGATVFGPASGQPGIAAAGSLGERLGSTLGLGVDVLNAALASGLRVLGGVSGAVSPFGAMAWPYAGPYPCSYCGDPCLTECCGYDCCCLFGAEGYHCCQGKVGTCC